MVSFFATIASLAVAVSGAAVEQRSCGPTVDLGYASYYGTRLEAGVDQYLGMRYARAPLGNLRFRAPQEPSQLCKPQDATKFRPICVGTSQTPGQDIDEDCLFVNVFTPSAATPDSKLPVWVYIQGGGYSTNSNANYNGTKVIQESGNNIIFVNFNYRVGVFGFLAGEAVRDDGDLNAGLLDQRLLLHWVQKHIHKFGGNPDHVVIHGASAGGGSVSYHLSAYGGQDPEDLFVGAIPQNPFWPTQRTVEEVEFQYSRLLHNTSCSSLDCLRELDQSTLLAAAPNSAFPESEPGDPTPLWYWLPVIDGDLVKDHMYKLFRQGKFRRVPTLVGDDTNEGTYFGYNAKSEAEVLSFMRANYPRLNDSQLSSIAELYPLMDPLPKHNAYFPSAAAAYGDSTFTCPGNMIAESLAQYLGPKRVWNYRYNVLDPANVANGLGVPHTFETSAIFGPGFAGQIDNSYYTTNAGIVPVTMAYFLSFVRFLDPNTARYEGAPVWMPWGAGMEKGERLRLQTNDTAMESVTGELVEKCMLWKRLAPTMEI